MSILDRLPLVGGEPVQIAHLAELRAAGCTREQVRAALRRGELDRVRIGWYCRPELAEPMRQAVRVGGALCCVSALRLRGLPVPYDHRLHIQVPCEASRFRSDRGEIRGLVGSARDRVVLHWTSKTQRLATPPLEPLLPALVRVAACLQHEWWLGMVEAALRSGVEGVARHEPRMLARLREALPQRRRWVLDAIDLRSESPLETVFRLRMLQAGIPLLVQQPLPGGFRADFLLDERIVIEVDGREYHGTAAAFDSDRARDAFLIGEGYLVLRFTYRQIVEEWFSVLVAVRRAREVHRRCP